MLTKLARTGAVSAALLLSVIAAPAAFASLSTMDELAASVTPTHSVITAKDGMTVYAFGMDADGTPTCYGACAAEWPPYLGNASETVPAGWSLVNRTDGTLQWAFHGRPLYFFARDKVAGDALGNGQNGIWHTISD
jgi:predicted lipoprotein with Yx(FWY)xxD motif